MLRSLSLSLMSCSLLLVLVHVFDLPCSLLLSLSLSLCVCVCMFVVTQAAELAKLFGEGTMFCRDARTGVGVGGVVSRPYFLMAGIRVESLVVVASVVAPVMEPRRTRRSWM